MKFHEMKECLACGSAAMQVYLDLGTQPLANSYHDGSAPQDAYPLAAQVCRTCFHSQLTVAVDPDLLYKHYLYVSGTTATLKNYFGWFVEYSQAFAKPGTLKVLDIASNDGSLLSQFKAAGHDVQGVDPAENLRALSEEKGVPTLVAYWGRETVGKLPHKYDVIVAMNVLGHLPYPLEFLEACADSLEDGGQVYIQTSQADIFRNFEFDTMYHEHHSFFTARSFRHLAARAGLHVVRGTKVPVHGNSYLWTLEKSPDRSDGSVAQIESDEERDGFYAFDTYERFAAVANDTARQLREVVAEFKAKGMSVGGYGAAAKGNTFLNFATVKLDFVIDDNPLKWGLLTPGMNIPIRAPTELAGMEGNIVLVVLAWNFYEEIARRVKACRPAHKDVFVRYFPSLEVCQEA